MLDFIIVLSIGILGLLAQAAGGKRVKRLVSVPRPVNESAPSGDAAEAKNTAAASDTEAGHSETAAAPLSSAQIKDEQTRASDVKSAINSSEVKAENSVSIAPDDGDEPDASQNKQPVTETAEAVAEETPALTATAEAVAEETPAVTETAGAVAEEAPALTETAEAVAEETPAVTETVGAVPEEAPAVSESHSAEQPAVGPPAQGPDTLPEVGPSAQVPETHREVGPSAQIPETQQEVRPSVQAPETSPEVRPAAMSETLAAPNGTAPANVAAHSVSPPSVREEFHVTRKPAIEWFLRITIFLWFIGLSLYYWMTSNGLTSEALGTPDPWVMQVTFVACALTGLNLVKGFRVLFSYIFTSIDCLFDIKLLKSTVKSWTAFRPAFEADRVFMPASIPHMVGFFIYVQTMFYLLASMTPKSDFQMPGLPLPMPLPLDQLFSYNGLGLVMLSFCGCGIFVTRSFREVLGRLALVRPTPPQIMIGLGLVFMSFMYDFLWAFYTHGQHLGLDSKLAGYNGGTFTASGGFTGALILALATAIFAGVGEETLIRGALQPVLGLVPAAVLHGVLHAQFQHAPIFIIQVAGWSILMGIVKRYTNTSTTIIGHAGFNFVTTFLFAYNPPDIL